jgi:hypothetical protein
MKTVIEIEPTKAALLKAIQDSGLRSLTEDQILVEPYAYDPRNGWNAHSVVIKDWGVFGFTDGPLNPIDVGHPESVTGTATSYYGVTTVNTLSPEEARAKRPEYPFATSPFEEERRPPEMARDQTVMHHTVNGKGTVGRLK